MHERGLAVDFRSKGSILNTSDFNWLKANAGAYGLKNLPSEKWPWSTNGH
jgi:LAS superfamily LD-carboxypeptidase LdcB